MITLRNYDISDPDRLGNLADNEHVSRFLTNSFPCPYTKTDAERWVGRGAKYPNSLLKVIQYEGYPVGSICLHPQSGWKQHVAEMGFWLGEPYWGLGIAPEALTAVTESALSELGYKKVFGEVLGPNEASMRVLEKCGYRLEGVLEYEVLKSGQYFDVYKFARCRR